MAKKQMTQQELRATIKETLLTAPELSNRAVARTLKCSPNTVGNVRKELIESGHIEQTAITDEWLNHWYLKQHPEILEKQTIRGLRALKADGVLDFMAAHRFTSSIYAQRLLNQMKKSERKNVSIHMEASDVDVRVGDLTSGLDFIPDESVNCIITDLPYSREYLPLYKALSEVAGRVLKDGGNLLVVCGHSALPEFLTALCSDERMRYHWCLSVVMHRSSSPLHWMNVSTHQKPIAHLVKNGSYKGELYSDLIMAKPADKKRDIPWEQPLDVFEELCARFIQKPDTVLLDCACGAGTTLIAGIKTGLCSKVIGVDIDAECVRISKKRVEELLFYPE